jgi:hypothetical protein
VKLLLAIALAMRHGQEFLTPLQEMPWKTPSILLFSVIVGS